MVGFPMSVVDEDFMFVILIRTRTYFVRCGSQSPEWIVSASSMAAPRRSEALVENSL